MYFLVCCTTSLPKVGGGGGGECVSTCLWRWASQVCLWAVCNLCNSPLRFPITFTDHSQNSARMNDIPVKKEVETFNRSSLKKTQTKTSSQLPTKEGECPLIFCSVPHSVHHCVKEHTCIWLLWSHCECTPSYLSPFQFSFVIKMHEKKGSVLAYEELQFMTFAPGTTTFQIRKAIKCAHTRFFLKRRRGQLQVLISEFASNLITPLCLCFFCYLQTSIERRRRRNKNRNRMHVWSLLASQCPDVACFSSSSSPEWDLFYHCLCSCPWFSRVMFREKALAQ